MIEFDMRGAEAYENEIVWDGKQWVPTGCRYEDIEAAERAQAANQRRRAQRACHDVYAGQWWLSN